MIDIGIKTKAGLVEPFTDNGIPVCARCGIKLTPANTSAWSDVKSANKTQKICKGCEILDETLAELTC